MRGETLGSIRIFLQITEGNLVKAISDSPTAKVQDPMGPMGLEPLAPQSSMHQHTSQIVDCDMGTPEGI